MANVGPGIVTNTIPSSTMEDASGVTVICAQAIESTGTIAAAGTNQGTAAPVIYAASWITGANGTAGVILPAANRNMVGANLMVKNDDTANAVLNVYPAGTDKINALAAGAAYTMAAKTATTFYCTAVGQWHTVPLVAS